MKKTIMFLSILTTTTLFGMEMGPEWTSGCEETWLNGRRTVFFNRLSIDGREFPYTIDYSKIIAGTFVLSKKDAFSQAPSRHAPFEHRGWVQISFETAKVVNFCQFNCSTNRSLIRIYASNNDEVFITLGQKRINYSCGDSQVIELTNSHPFKTYRIECRIGENGHSLSMNGLHFGYQEQIEQ